MIRRATIEDLEDVQEIVRKTINEIYPNYYPQEVVDFFLNHHKQENIMKDIHSGNVYILMEDGSCIGTGTANEENISRVFVLPNYQGKGYGSKIMDFLEKIISDKYDIINLDSSLPAFKIYLKRGYKPIDYLEQPVENGRVLCYQVMTKSSCKK
ncbi:GNAT family N-acetyltransferase [Bacteroides ihuae]|uniref:GNAT family N-acetyltransferase n=1 Tax=Bacteroides ihuae TaxID=1852362 RepID=UPI0008DB0FBC|nr:GNAT family N-acetyltransferase [Bacteroides ihuae]